MPRSSRDQTPSPLCPVCGEKGMPVVYGKPGKELIEKAKRGEVELGGCFMRSEHWHCPACKKHW